MTPGALSQAWVLRPHGGNTAAMVVLLFAVAVSGCATFPPAPSPTPDFEPAGWTLDPALPSPKADATVLHILVYERFCSGGSPATGRMSTPLIEYAAQTVTITIRVRRLSGPQGCPAMPGTPSTVRLDQPLGHRTLVDAGGPVGV